MSFMEKQIEFGQWIVYDSKQGGGVLPADLCEATPEGILEFTDCHNVADIYEVEVKSGFGARLSAPGYMDCTEWRLYDSETEAQEALSEEYGDDEEDQPEEGDLTTEDHSHFYQYGKLVLTISPDATTSEMWTAINAFMADAKFWPSVWFISDHGNVERMK